jgi:transcriptional regulator
MLTGILGFELQVLDLQFKLKLNQHRPEASLAMQAIYENGKDCDQYLGRWMKRIAK